MSKFKRYYNRDSGGNILRSKTGIKENGDNVYIHERMDKSSGGRGTHEGYEVNYTRGTFKEFRR